MRKRKDQRLNDLERNINHIICQINSLTKKVDGLQEYIKVLYLIQSKNDFNVVDDIPQEKELKQALKQAEKELKDLQREVLKDDE